MIKVFSQGKSAILIFTISSVFQPSLLQSLEKCQGEMVRCEGLCLPRSILPKLSSTFKLCGESCILAREACEGSCSEVLANLLYVYKRFYSASNFFFVFSFCDLGKDYLYLGLFICEAVGQLIDCSIHLCSLCMYVCVYIVKMYI